MNTKLLMSAAAVTLGAAGIALSFLPREILTMLDEPPSQTVELLLQLLGALSFGFAMLDWMAKESALGGIYGRPIVAGNSAHFVIGALALIKGMSDHQHIELWIAAGVYTVFALLFSILMYTNPSTK